MSIPKKPLAVSRAKKKLPVELDWGPGVPKDRLAYINADEKALIQRFRKTKAAREYAGIPAYADDSASSKGVERGADGPSGVGRGPSGGKSSTPSSSSGSKPSSSSSSTSGGGNKSSSSASTRSAATSKPSSAPNAAAQAASNKLNSSSSASRSPTTNAGASGSVSRPSVSPSKAPNAAASYASGKLNATANALKSAQQPQSIQSMINSQRTAPVGSATAAEEMTRRSFVDAHLGYLNKDPAISRNITNAVGNAMWNTRIADAKRMAANQPARGNFGEVYPQAGNLAGFRTLDQQRDIMNRGASKSKSPDRSYHTWGMSIDVNPPMNPGETIQSTSYGNRTMAVNKEIMANMDDPNVTWGGDWKWKDPGHFQYGSGSAANSAATHGANVKMAGTRPSGTVAPDTALAAKAPPAGTKPAPGDKLKAALDSWNVPKPGSIPTPNGQTVASSIPSMQNYPPTPHFGPPMPSSGIATAPLGPITRDPAAARMAGIQQTPQTMVAGDPRVSMPPGSLASPERGSPPGYMSQFAMNEQDMANLKTQAMKDFSFGDLMKMQQNQSALPGFMGPITKDAQRVAQAPAPVQQAAAVPQGPLPSALPGFKPPGLPGNFRGTAGQAYTYNSPSNWSPQVAAGDAVPEDGPVYSDNPMQGPVNPMQEGPAVEDPGVTKQRQQKYAGRGATIGSVIAGPLGAVVGGTLGWQMGKTSPQQRQAIASNAKAVQANVQSINQMVEERGGKGNPQMRVTESGFRDVLTNPQKVTQNPGNYTTLEQMLAALAQGIDPETGKPIA